MKKGISDHLLLSVDKEEECFQRRMDYHFQLDANPTECRRISQCLYHHDIAALRNLRLSRNV